MSDGPEIRRLDPVTYADRWWVRPDADAKLTGALRYPTDETVAPDALHGQILRAGVPHARIVRLNVEAARCVPGVHAVLTWRDVPGVNAFGIVYRDQPVLCTDRVRFVGDALAAVAGDTQECVERALKSIEVELEPLPVIGDPMQALAGNAPWLHEQGNLAAATEVRRGDPDAAFARCDVVVEEIYSTPRQMPAFLETEGGYAVPESDGGIRIVSGCQSPHRDRVELAAILGLPQDRVRVVGPATGGAFGGKDELTIQPVAALLALSTGRPVRMHLSRKESTVTGIKRHPVVMSARTGCDAKGRILAHQVSAVLDTGAYASLGPSVLMNLVEHAAAPLYDIPDVHVEGKLVYTNNGVSGALRGFGGNQATFAVEGQLDRLAAELRMDPAVLRRRNLRAPSSAGVAGQSQQMPVHTAHLLDAALTAPVMRSDEQRPSGRWCHGVGLALGIQGNGLGNGIPDSGGGSLRLRADGVIELALGFVDYGQGVAAAAQLHAAEVLGCAPRDIHVRLGDSAASDSGPTSATRSTVVLVEVLRRLGSRWLEQVKAAAAPVAGVDVADLELGPGGVWRRKNGEGGRVIGLRDLAQRLPGADLPWAETAFEFPSGPDEQPHGRFLLLTIATVARVRVDVFTGEVFVDDLHHVTAGGRVLHPANYLGQIEGAAVMGLGMTLMEDAPLVDGQYAVTNLDGYLVPTIRDAPRQRVDVIEEVLGDDRHAVRGIGELGIEAIAPAIIAAVRNATGVQVADLPLLPGKLAAAMAHREEEAHVHTR